MTISEEKVALANQMNEIINKYSKRLQHDLNKFKMELEADNAGVTEMLEKRNLLKKLITNFVLKKKGN